MALSYTVEAYSDIIDVADTHDNTVLISSSNKYPYAGIVFSDFDHTFNIRVLCRFYWERAPQENESERLSDGGIVKLSSTTKTQKLLEVDLAPFHFHLAIKLALQCNRVSIDGANYIMEESYETNQVNMRNPYELGTVWLTSKDNEFFTNVFGE